VSYDRETGKPRGFGFVVFENPTVADRVVKNKHTIDRREVRCISRRAALRRCLIMFVPQVCRNGRSFVGRREACNASHGSDWHESWRNCERERFAGSGYA
jgi:RNA recognition motif-containing protein